jgi:hypothetical protein
MKKMSDAMGLGMRLARKWHDGNWMRRQYERKGFPSMDTQDGIISSAKRIFKTKKGQDRFIMGWKFEMDYINMEG